MSDRPRPHPCFGCGELRTLHFALTRIRIACKTDEDGFYRTPMRCAIDG